MTEKLHSNNVFLDHSQIWPIMYTCTQTLETNLTYRRRNKMALSEILIRPPATINGGEGGLGSVCEPVSRPTAQGPSARKPNPRCGKVASGLRAPSLSPSYRLGALTSHYLSQYGSGKWPKAQTSYKPKVHSIRNKLV